MYPNITPPAIARFWAKVDITPSCGLWTAALLPNGYGKFSWRQDGAVYTWSAHRLAWALTFGPIPDDAHVLHRCDVKPCCIPHHLFLGDADTNMRDMVEKGRSNRGEAVNTATLTESQVREIRQRWRYRVVTQSMLAAEYGVTQSTISALIIGHSWRHVT